VIFECVAVRSGRSLKPVGAGIALRILLRIRLYTDDPAFYAFINEVGMDKRNDIPTLVLLRTILSLDGKVVKLPYTLDLLRQVP
jgi:hypothetical protein